MYSFISKTTNKYYNLLNTKSLMQYFPNQESWQIIKTKKQKKSKSKSKQVKNFIRRDKRVYLKCRQTCTREAKKQRPHP